MDKIKRVQLSRNVVSHEQHLPCSRSYDVTSSLCRKAELCNCIGEEVYRGVACSPVHPLKPNKCTCRQKGVRNNKFYIDQQKQTEKRLP